MISKTILIRINPASNGFAIVLTNHNVAGSENRKEVVTNTFKEAQATIAEFLTQVAETDAAQEVAKVRKETEAAAKADRAQARAES